MSILPFPSSDCRNPGSLEPTLQGSLFDGGHFGSSFGGFVVLGLLAAASLQSLTMLHHRELLVALQWLEGPKKSGAC